MSVRQVVTNAGVMGGGSAILTTPALTAEALQAMSFLGITVGGWIFILVSIGMVALAIYNIWKLCSHVVDRYRLYKKLKKEEEVLLNPKKEVVNADKVAEGFI